MIPLPILSFVLSKWKIFAVAGVIGAVVLGSGWVGWSLRDGIAEREKIEAVARAIGQQEKLQAEYEEIMEAHVENQANLRKRFEEIRNDIENISFSGCDSFDDDWVRLLNDAIKASGSAETD